MADHTGQVLAQITLWNMRHPAQRIDPAAALAVARQEGLGGGVGDNGTSVGPWQLHQGGALPAYIPLASANQWAWSPAGLQYALSRIASVAGGLTGGQAVRNIVARFERPANIPRETQNALAALGLPLTYQLPNQVAPLTTGRLPATQPPIGTGGPAVNAHALAALQALLAQHTAPAAPVDPGFLPLTVPAPVAQAPLAQAPLAAFTSPLLQNSYGTPLGNLGAPAR